jgi:hypothetical protein
VSFAPRPTTIDLLLLYPGKSLGEQIRHWASKDAQRHVDVSFERSLPRIRQLLRRTGATLLDATTDPAATADAFLQAVACHGAGAVSVYTEVMHEDIELFVRLRGSLFLLGPLLDEQWEALFEPLMRAERVRLAPAGRRPLAALEDPTLVERT